LRTLHFYLTRQILAALVMTVLVFTFVLLLGNVLKEILFLLISGQASLTLVGRALALLLPFVLAFALPMGMLTATLLVFGRFSADQELTAARASGISLVALASPVLLLGVAASCLSAWINMDVAPRCRTLYRDLFRRVAIEQAASFIEADRIIEDFDGFIVHVGAKDGSRLDQVSIYELTDDRRMKRIIRAARAEILTDTVNVEAVLRLYEVTYYDFDALQPAYAEQADDLRLSYRPDSQGKARKVVRDMTFLELWRTLNEYEGFTEMEPVARGASAEQLREQHRQLRELRSELATPIRMHIHRQVAFSFACLGFTLLGVPLGVRAHRRETSAGIALALLLVIVYYAFVILAESLQDQPQYGPHLILWIPNFILQIGGGYLLWNANRGT
jgi:lipopolysaccharide export system permease protein